MSELVILSLGSNLGDREENLASAITLLGTYHQITNMHLFMNLNRYIILISLNF